MRTISACCFTVSLKSSVGMDGLTSVAATDTSPFRIVSQSGADRNIPDVDCCGEAVGIRSYRLKAMEKPDHHGASQPGAVRCGSSSRYYSSLESTSSYLRQSLRTSEDIPIPLPVQNCVKCLDSEHVALGQPAKEKYKRLPSVMSLRMDSSAGSFSSRMLRKFPLQ